MHLHMNVQSLSEYYGRSEREGVSAYVWSLEAWRLSCKKGNVGNKMERLKVVMCLVNPPIVHLA
jgi:hypothetical protein